MQDKRQKTIILDLVGVVVNINLERDDKALRAIDQMVGYLQA